MTADEIRRRFASKRSGDTPAPRADDLVDQLDDHYTRLPLAPGWTRRAVWYENDDALLAVVGDQERSDSDTVLAHGLHLRGERTLRLVLPKAWAHPTSFRQPWLKPGVVDVWTHANGKLAHPTPLNKDQTRHDAGDVEKRRPYVLGAQATDWVRSLIEWATRHRELVEAHTSSLRAWSHNGQRVLTITGKRRVQIKAGIDAKSSPADLHTVDAPLDAATTAAIRKRVEQGIKHAHSRTFGDFEEHHLQVLLRRSPTDLGLEHPVLREIPAWRPSGGTKERGRGFIDLVASDGAGDLVLVETKLGSDEMLILQGLDYWIWATNPENASWLRERLYVDTNAPIKLLYAVGGKKGATPRLGRYELATLASLDAEIPWRVALLTAWNSGNGAGFKLLDPLKLPT